MSSVTPWRIAPTRSVPGLMMNSGCRRRTLASTAWWSVVGSGTRGTATPAKAMTPKCTPPGSLMRSSCTVCLSRSRRLTLVGSWGSAGAPMLRDTSSSNPMATRSQAGSQMTLGRVGEAKPTMASAPLVSRSHVCQRAPLSEGRVLRRRTPATWLHCRPSRRVQPPIVPEQRAEKRERDKSPQDLRIVPLHVPDVVHSFNQGT